MQRIRGGTIMRYINLPFTYLLYLHVGPTLPPPLATPRDTVAYAACLSVCVRLNVCLSVSVCRVPT